MPVLLESNHGSFTLASTGDDTIATVLRRAGVPLSAVWTYFVEDHAVDVRGGRGGRRVRFVPVGTRLSDNALHGRVICARVTRNINLPALLGWETSSVREATNPTTEWTFAGPEEGAFGRIEMQLTADDCQSIVQSSVDQVLARWPLAGTPRLVVGTSGGGDSNILISALLNSPHISPSDVIPVMMLGIPDWDLQVSNARELCASLGTRLHVIEPLMLRHLLASRPSKLLRGSSSAVTLTRTLSFWGRGFCVACWVDTPRQKASGRSPSAPTVRTS